MYRVLGTVVHAAMSTVESWVHNGSWPLFPGFCWFLSPIGSWVLLLGAGRSRVQWSMPLCLLTRLAVDSDRLEMVLSSWSSLRVSQYITTQTCNKSSNSQVQVQVQVHFKRASPSPSPSPLQKRQVQVQVQKEKTNLQAVLSHSNIISVAVIE